MEFNTLNWKVILLASVVATLALGDKLLNLGDPVELDRGFNISGIEPMNARDKAPVKVYQYDIPAELVPKDSLVESQFLDAPSRNVIFIEKGGKKYVRFYVADGPNMNFKEFDAEYAKHRLAETLVGRKLQSHGTFRVTRPGDSSFPRLDIKMTQADGYNPGEELLYAIRNNDRIELAMKDRDRDVKMVSFMPERFAASLGKGKSNYAFSLRLHEGAGNPDTDVLQTVPLHGLLGNEEVLTKIAERRGMTRDEWMLKEYLPKLGEFHAQLNFRHGIYLQGHTQNTLLRINRQTGAIDGIVGRDISDLMYAPHHRVLQKRKPVIFEGVADEIYRFFQMRGLEQPGGHAEAYTRQAVNAAFGSVSNREDDAAKKESGRRAFLKSYLAEVERITGQTLPRTVELKFFMEKEPTVGNAIGEIHKLMALKRLPKISPGMIPANQTELAGIFKSRDRQGGVSYLTADAPGYIDHLGPDSLAYATDGKGIFLVEKSTNRPIAYAHSLSTTDSALVAAAVPCPGRYSSLK